MDAASVKSLLQRSGAKTGHPSASSTPGGNVTRGCRKQSPSLCLWKEVKGQHVIVYSYGGHVIHSYV